MPLPHQVVLGVSTLVDMASLLWTNLTAHFMEEISSVCSSHRLTTRQASLLNELYGVNFRHPKRSLKRRRVKMKRRKRKLTSKILGRVFKPPAAWRPQAGRHQQCLLNILVI
jgi:hypothetical protein